MKLLKRINRNSETSEKSIEQYLRTQVEMLGGKCLKYSNPNETGYPDRVCLFPDAICVWVEIKSAGKKPTKLQALRLAELNALGFPAYVADSRAVVNDIISKIRRIYDL